QRSKPDVTLLSLVSHDHRDLRVIYDVARTSGQSRLLVLVSDYDKEFRMHAVLQGAWGILERDRAPEHLLKAIQTVSDARKMVGSGISGRLSHSSLAITLARN